MLSSCCLLDTNLGDCERPLGVDSGQVNDLDGNLSMDAQSALPGVHKRQRMVEA